MWSNIVSFESVFELDVNQYCKFYGIQQKKKWKYNFYTNKLEEIWNHIKCSIKTTYGRKTIEDKIRTNNKKKK